MCGFACNFGSVKAPGQTTLKRWSYDEAHKTQSLCPCSLPRWRAQRLTNSSDHRGSHTRIQTENAYCGHEHGRTGNRRPNVFSLFQAASWKQPNLVRSHNAQNSLRTHRQVGYLYFTFGLIQNLRIPLIYDLKLWTIKSPQGKYDSWLGPLKERLSVCAIGVC